MDAYFERVKDYLLELNFTIIQEDAEDGLFVVENEEQGITNTVLIVADPMLIVEQLLCELSTEDASVYQQLLIKNRDIIHGAFALDDSGKKLFFRNTHECENLDLNELEATLNSLAILLSEYSEELIKISK
jgi:hypothetical protein